MLTAQSSCSVVTVRPFDCPFCPHGRHYHFGFRSVLVNSWLSSADTAYNDPAPFPESSLWFALVPISLQFMVPSIDWLYCAYALTSVGSLVTVIAFVAIPSVFGPPLARCSFAFHVAPVAGRPRRSLVLRLCYCLHILTVLD
ncbi:hypothetical protein R1flu_019159 [Riccia fluitans]|uniref:Uncharacterized protein n=1 Tax=Riccia fluitans TaxID=41844 RepID=A0ABD1ZHV5_9MARC